MMSPRLAGSARRYIALYQGSDFTTIVGYLSLMALFCVHVCLYLVLESLTKPGTDWPHREPVGKPAVRPTPACMAVLLGALSWRFQWL